MTHEIFQGGQIVNWRKRIPLDADGLRLEGEEVMEFPHYPEMTRLVLKLGKCSEFNGNLECRDAQVIKMGTFGKEKSQAAPWESAGVSFPCFNG